MLAFALAALSAVLFGAMAVAIRLSFRPGSDPEALSLATTAGALVVCLVLAAPFLGGLTWHGVWPFLAAGALAPRPPPGAFLRGPPPRAGRPHAPPRTGKNTLNSPPRHKSHAP